MRSEPFLLVPESRRWPIVLISLHRHSTSSALGFSVWTQTTAVRPCRLTAVADHLIVPQYPMLARRAHAASIIALVAEHRRTHTSVSSSVMQPCMIFSVSILCWYRFPMNWILPRALRRPCTTSEAQQCLMRSACAGEVAPCPCAKVQQAVQTQKGHSEMLVSDLELALGCFHVLSGLLLLLLSLCLLIRVRYLTVFPLLLLGLALSLQWVDMRHQGAQGRHKEQCNVT